MQRYGALLLLPLLASFCFLQASGGPSVPRRRNTLNQKAQTRWPAVPNSVLVSDVGASTCIPIRRTCAPEASLRAFVCGHVDNRLTTLHSDIYMPRRHTRSQEIVCMSRYIQRCASRSEPKASIQTNTPLSSINSAHNFVRCAVSVCPSQSLLSRSCIPLPLLVHFRPLGAYSCFLGAILTACGVYVVRCRYLCDVYIYVFAQVIEANSGNKNNANWWVLLLLLLWLMTSMRRK